MSPGAKGKGGPLCHPRLSLPSFQLVHGACSTTRWLAWPSSPSPFGPRSPPNPCGEPYSRFGKARLLFGRAPLPFGRAPLLFPGGPPPLSGSHQIPAHFFVRALPCFYGRVVAFALPTHQPCWHLCELRVSGGEERTAGGGGGGGVELPQLCQHAREGQQLLREAPPLKVGGAAATVAAASCTSG
eukprot:scaffold5390_cov116-Isochrysis_galbana.AAC.2